MVWQLIQSKESKARDRHQEHTPEEKKRGEGSRDEIDGGIREGRREGARFIEGAGIAGAWLVWWGWG